LRIAVVFGGSSVEHEISIITGMQILASINKNKYKVIPVYLTKSNVFTIGKDFDKIETFKDNNLHFKEVCFTRKRLKTTFRTIPIDAVICAGHGRGLEGGELAGYFEILNIPYTSSSVLEASIFQDKIAAKKLLAYDGIKTTPFVGITDYEWKTDREYIVTKCNELNYPVIIKPAKLGSSIGIEKVDEARFLQKTISEAFRFDDAVIVEKFLDNYREFNCAIINNDKLSAIEEVKSQNKILTFNDKYEDSLSERVIPAEISEELKVDIENLTVKIANLFNNKGVIRIDYLYDINNKELLVNEVNTIPGSFSYYLYEDVGIYFDELIDVLIEGAVKEAYLKGNKINSFTSNVLNIKGIKK